MLLCNADTGEYLYGAGLLVGIGVGFSIGQFLRMMILLPLHCERGTGVSYLSVTLGNRSNAGYMDFAICPSGWKQQSVSGSFGDLCNRIPFYIRYIYTVILRNIIKLINIKEYGRR